MLYDLLLDFEIFRVFDYIENVDCVIFDFKLCFLLSFLVIFVIYGVNRKFC